MALMGYFIVFSFVTKPGQTLEFLLWGTIVPLNFLAGYYCSIVASTPQPTVYAFTNVHMALMGYLIVFSFVTKPGQSYRISLVGYHCSIEFPCGVPLFYCCKYPTTLYPYTPTHTVHMALMGYFIVFSFVTKPGQTLEFLLRGTIVPLNFLAGYHCSIVASTPQPMAYAFTHTHTQPDTWHLWGTLLSSLLWPIYRISIVPLNFLVGYHCSIVASTPHSIPVHTYHTHTFSKMHPCGDFYCFFFCCLT